MSPNSTDVYYYNGTPGSWTHIGSGPALYAVNDDNIYRLNGTTYNIEVWNQSGNIWQVIGGPAYDIFAGGTGVYLTDSNGNEEKYSGTPGQWNVIAGLTAAFAASETNLYGLGPNDSYVALYSGSGNVWSQIGGPASQIVAGVY